VDLRWAMVYLQDREPAWIDKLAADIEVLKTLLRRIRRAVGRLPKKAPSYYVWYSTDDADAGAVIRLERLFHTRQQAPQPRLRG